MNADEVNIIIRMERRLRKTITMLESITSNKTIEEKLIDVRRYVDQGADVNTDDTYGRILLCDALGCGKVLLIKLLLKHGADVNVKDLIEETPLHHAVRNNRMSAVVLLLRNGAKVNARCKNGKTPLHIATQLGLIDMTKMLLNYGADIKSQDKQGFRILHEAVSSGKIDIVDFLLNKVKYSGANVNVADQLGQTSLHCASKSGVAAVVQLLIDKGAMVFKQTSNGDTALHYAVRSGNFRVVRLLVKKGINVNSFTVRGETPLHEALRSKEINVIEFLLNEGADVNFKTFKGETPLHTALFSDNIAAVSLLLTKGAQVNVKTKDGSTPLHYAAHTSDINSIQLLLNYGAEINSQDKNGYTPLHLAVHHLKNSVAEYLLNNGAYASIQTQTGNTPLHLLIEQYSTRTMNRMHFSTYPLIPLGHKVNELINKRMIQTILRKGVNTNVQDRHGMTALHLAAGNCLPFAVDALLKNGADVNLKNTMGNTALHETLRKKHTSSNKVVKLLLTKDFDINIRNLEGKTALHLAIQIEVTQIEEWLKQSSDLKTSETLQWTLSNSATEFQELSVTQLLLDFGADVNIQDIYGNTPIHEASIYGSTIALLLMLKKNANVNMQNSDGETPLHVAVRHQYDELATLLIARGSDVMIRNKDGGTPLKYALMMSFGKRRKLINALQTAEEIAKYNISINKPDLSFSQQVVQSPQIYEYNYARKTDNLGMPGQLYETKLVSLVFIRMLNYDKIEHHILLGINIDGIGAMDDICLRYRAKGQQKSAIIFIQAKHRENLKEKIKNKDLWGKSGDFSLIKYFKSYLLIREQFQVNNNDPMFEGAFCDVDCYLILYTPAKENLTKKNTNSKINEKVHDLISSNSELQPFQYDYDEGDIYELSKALAMAKNENNSNNCISDHIKELVQDFFSKLWFYTDQEQEEKIENLVKDEINKHYNDIFVASYPNFQSISSSSIFLKAHQELQKWWMMKKAAYLRREDDFFRSAKLSFLDEVLAITFNAIKDNKCKVDLEFNQRFYDTQTSEEAYKGISTIMSSFVKFIDKNNKLITTNINSKNINICLDQTQAIKITLPRVDTKNFSQPLLSDNNTAVPGDTRIYDNKQFLYSKRDGTSEASGALYRRNLICLIYLRLLQHTLIDENPKIGSKIQGINLMNDICLRYTVKRQQKPAVVFMQLIHREDPNTGKLTDESFWSDHSDFSLSNYFKSYISIKERFQSINADPMFEGDFHNIDSYFVIYTSTKDKHRKKKNLNKIDKIVKDLTLTSQSKSKLFQHEYSDDEIKHLADLIINDEIENLGMAFQKCILSERNNPLTDKFIKRYHVALAQHVLKQCDQQTNQTGNEKYRLWQFRPDFFTRDQQYFVILKKTIIKMSAKKSCTENEILQKLQSLKIKLPFEFGNLDMKFSGNEAKVRKRIHYLVDKVADLLDQHKDTKIVEIRNEDVGSGKIIEQGIVDINGGIGSAVSNLLIIDTDTDMLKFINLEIENLPNNAALFLKELENKGYDDLSAYRFKIHVTGFPKLSFEADEFDKIQVRGFMNKIWFFTNQAKQDAVGRIFAKEFTKVLAQKSDYRIYNYNKSNIFDHISLLTLDKVQKWWLLPHESPYLSRVSKLFECADQEDTYNILLSFMNYMFISNIYSFNVSVDNFNGNPDQLQSLFNKIVINLFKIFDPLYDADISGQSYLSVISEKTTLCIKIHQDMEWVALIMTCIKRSAFKNGDVRQCLVAEAGPVRGLYEKHEEFKMYELYELGELYRYRDCIKNTTKEVVRRRNI